MSTLNDTGRLGRYRSISAKLNFILLLTVVVTFVGAGLVLDNWLTNRLQTRGIAELQQVNHQVIDMVDAYATALEKSAEMLGETFSASLPKHLAVDAQRLQMTGETALPVLRSGDGVLNNQFEQVDQFNKATGGFATLFVRYNDDFFRVSTSLRNAQGNRVMGTALGNTHPAYRNLMDGKPYTGPATLFGRNYMTRYMPIRDAAGQTIAVAFIGLDFTEGLQALKTKVRSLRIGEQGYSFVLDAAKEPGLAIIHPAAEGKNIIDATDKNGTPIIRQFLQQKSGEVRYWWLNSELGETGAREKIAILDSFERWGWLVGTSAYMDEFSREVVTVRRHLILTGIIILGLLGVAIVWATHRWVTRPLTHAVEITQKVAEGDLTQHITAVSNDEVGQLLASLDSMSGQLRSMVREVDAGIRHLASSAHQLTMASGTVAQGSGEQSQSASTMATTVEEMTASINQVAQHAEACRDMASHSGAISDHGIAVINQAIDGMKRISDTVGQSSEAVGHLGDESQQISHIVNVIREIADQTNLLALNAAIEAARAGEAGRGFAVVADEVRKLAERTTLSTQEITQMVDRIQQGATNAVERMRQGETQVADGVTLANDAGAKITEIKMGADEVSKAVIGISDALREQNAANQQIARNVELIAEQAGVNHRQAQQTADTALGMETLAEQLRGTIARFRT